MTSRIVQLLVGLVLYGAGCAIMVRAGIGLDPWTVFAQGLSRQTGVGIGWVTNIVGFLVLLLWIPLRQRPGLGTVANILLVGTSMQATLAVFPAVDGFALQLIAFVAGMVLVAVASGLYIGADFGPGPRDGLMTGLHARFGWPIWAARLGVEVVDEHDRRLRLRDHKGRGIEHHGNDDGGEEEHAAQDGRVHR